MARIGAVDLITLGSAFRAKRLKGCTFHIQTDLVFFNDEATDPQLVRA
jgi:hypothetical protein